MRSSRTVRGPGRSGFTLFEVLIVVLMIGIIAGLVASRLAATTGHARRRDALRSVTTLLAEARVTAMRRSAAETVTLSAGTNQISVSWDERERSWSGLKMTPVDSLDTPLESLEARFDPEGRTRQRIWRFMGPERGDTIWVITFDPVSGAPRLDRESGEQSAG